MATQTVLDLPVITYMDEADILYVIRGVAAGRDKQITAVNGFMPKSLILSSSTPVDLSTYGGDVNIVATGSITITVSNLLRAGRTITIVNGGSSNVVVTGTVACTLYPDQSVTSISDGSNMNAGCHVDYDTSGNVGIGKAPTTKLDVNGTATITGLALNGDMAITGSVTTALNVNSTLDVDSTVKSGTTGTNGSFELARISDGATVVGLGLSGNSALLSTNQADGDIIFNANSTEVGRFDAGDGTFLIGTSTTTAYAFPFHVHKNSLATYMRFSNSSSGEGNADGLLFGLDSSTAKIINQEAGVLELWTNNTKYLDITAAGEVNISKNNLNLGSTGVNGKLQLYRSTDGAVASSLYTLSSNTALAAVTGDLIFQRGGSYTEAGRITSAGAFTMGTTGTNGSITLNRTSDGADITDWYTDGTSVYLRAYGGASYLGLEGTLGITFDVAGAETARMMSSGVFSVGLTSPQTWSASFAAIQLGSCTSFMSPKTGVGNSYIINNLYYDGAWKHQGVGYGSTINQGSGTVTFNTTSTVSGTATLVERMRLSQAGVLAIGNASPKTWASTFNALQIGNDAAIWGQNSTTATYYSAHVHYDGSWKFLGSGTYYGTYCVQSDGNHSWGTTTTSGTDGGAATPTELMLLNRSGQLQLGVNTTYTAGINQAIYSPSATFSYTAYQTASTGSGNSNGALIGYDNTNGISIYNYENTGILFATNNTTRMTISSAGKVTIGGTSIASDYGLYVSNTSSSGWGAGILCGNVTSDSYILFNVANNAGLQFQVRGSGTVNSPGIWNTVVTTAYRDVVVGTSGSYTNALGYVSSCRRSKINIEYGIDTSWIYDLKPVEFEYRKTGDNGTASEPEWLDEGNGEKVLGLIAEDVNEVYPELVIKDSEDPERLLSVRYSSLTTPLLNEVQKLKAENDALKSQLANILERMERAGI